MDRGEGRDGEQVGERFPHLCQPVHASQGRAIIFFFFFCCFLIIFSTGPFGRNHMSSRGETKHGESSRVLASPHTPCPGTAAALGCQRGGCK